MTVLSKQAIIDLFRAGELTQEQIEEFYGVDTFAEIITGAMEACYVHHYS